MEQRRKMKLNEPLKVKIELSAGIELLSSKDKLKIGDLEGRSDRLKGHPTYGFTGGKSEESMKTVEWIVRASKPDSSVTVSVLSQKAGKDTKTIRVN